MARTGPVHLTQLLRHRLAPVAVGALVTVVVTIGAPLRATYGARTTADEPHYLLTAISLWEDHDLDVSDERAEVRYLDFHEVLLPIQAEQRPDGTQVAPHDPLLPLLLAAPTGLGGWLAAKLALATVAGVLAALTMVVAMRRFGVAAEIAGPAAVIAGASPPLAIYGTQVYPELTAAVTVLAAFWWLTGPLGRRQAVGAAAAIVTLPWLSVKYSPVAVVLAVALIARLWRRSRRGAVAAALVAFGGAGVLYLAAHQWLYDGWTVYASGSHFTDGELSVIGRRPDYAGRTRRLVGLLVDRDFGLAVWQPAALAVVPAMTALVRRRPPGTVLLGAVFAAGWLNATFVALTMHGWWWPGRQTVVVLPLAVVAIAWWAGRLGRHGRRVLAGAGAIGVVAYVFLIAGVLGGRHTLVVDFDRTLDPFVRAMQLLAPDGRRDDLWSWLLTAVWTGALSAWALTAWRRAGGPAPITSRSVAAMPGPVPHRRDPSPV